MGPLNGRLNSALIMIHDELNRFTGSLPYSAWHFIFSAMAQGGGGAGGMAQCPLNMLVGPWH